ncbi:pancreatic lipase-related protein 2-like [Euwallacea similis]|uniref:pancreatic lipase-related protein 2-like n=1 Tax=Euwallacea similis TaxID=1736056 RepID=UPI00344CC4C3
MYFSLVLSCLLAFASCENIKREAVSYIIYSRSNLDGSISRSPEDSAFNIIVDAFNPNLPTIVLIHGWLDNYESNFNTYIRSAVLTKIDANIIKVDWSSFSTQLYSIARDAVPTIGALTAELIQSIYTYYDYSADNVTLVGFSLGAHVAATVGKNLEGNIGTLVALDPAGPGINSQDLSYSVHPTDAQYVQVIHTNAGTLGMIDPVGHADYYPNGGSRQAGCGIDIIGSCSHNRAWNYFVESISDNQFMAVNCATWDELLTSNCHGGRVFMGGLSNIDRSAKGLFYLETNTATPFGRS